MRLPPRADIVWTSDVLKSRTIDDVYFSQDGGLEETRAVFLAGCGLPEAWAGRARFTVGELGFGTGLNAMATWDLWRRTRAPGAALHVVSFEAAPIEAADAARALEAFPELTPLVRRLLAAWPVRAFGPQRLWFPEDGFALTVWIGDARAVLPEVEGPVDAWFLDGFAPARNPEMWGPDLLTAVARASAPGARLATYSVARPVRDALEAAGFAWEKRPGFGAKRERLEAHLAQAPAHAWSPFPRGGERPGGVAIVGAGIGGAAVARALALRGVRAQVFDAAPDLGAGASGNPAALVMPRLDRGPSPAERFYRAAYLHALAAYRDGPGFHPCGVEERPESAEAAAALANLLADPPLPEALLQARGPGAWHPLAGVASPKAILAHWLEGADLHLGVEAAALQPLRPGWRLIDARGAELARADAVILCCGPALARFAETAWLPLSFSRGQIEHAPAPTPGFAAAGGPYAAPAPGGGMVYGATFDPVAAPTPQAAHAADRARNLAALTRLAPEWAAEAATGGSSRAALRAAAPDRMPIAGPLPDAPGWIARYEGLARGAPLDLSSPPPALAGLYVLGALGARGFVTAPLLAEVIASALYGEPAPLAAAELDALHPARFLVRGLKRGRLPPRLAAALPPRP